MRVEVGALSSLLVDRVGVGWGCVSSEVTAYVTGVGRAPIE